VKVGIAQGYRLETIYKFQPEEWLAAMEGDESVRDRIDESLLAAAGKRSADLRPSMGQDIVKGRRTEIDYINGLVVARGRELGIPTPANEGLTEAVKRVERGDSAPALANVASI
jgi:2-dehydropantoate 2-reductase